MNQFAKCSGSTASSSAGTPQDKESMNSRQLGVGGIFETGGGEKGTDKEGRRRIISGESF
jgi:hypothetical protein